MSSGGGLALLDGSRAEIDKSTFHNNRAKEGGGAVVAAGDAVVEISQGKVVNNTCGTDGGGIWLSENSAAKLLYCTLANNTAMSSGGGIFSADAAKLYLGPATWVHENKAGGYGGGVMLLNDAFNVSAVDNAVANNTAPSDPDISVAIREISVDKASVPDFVSRLGHADVLLVNVNVSGLYDLPCQGVNVYAALEGSWLDVDTTDADGMATLKLKIIKAPGTYNLTFKLADNIYVPTVNVTVFVVNCSIGEVAVSSGASRQPDACQTCPRGSYSLDPRNYTCDGCVTNAECHGGANIVSLPGYWHSSRRSPQVHRCFNPTACQGNRMAPQNGGYTNMQCSGGHEGNLCGVCATDYGKVKAFTCRRCMSRDAIVALYVLAAFGMLGFLKALCHFTLMDSGITNGHADNATVTKLLKHLVIWSQYMLIVSNLDVNWPQTLMVPLQALGWFWSSSSPQTIGLDCLLPREGVVPVAALRVLLGLCMPVVMVIALLIIDEVTTHIRRRFNRANHTNTARGSVASTACVVTFTFLPSIVRTLFGMFACVPIDTYMPVPYVVHAVGSFWESDMSLQCYTGYHKIWAFAVGIPMTILVCIVLPACIAYSAWHRRTCLNDEYMRRNWGFLYQTYRPTCCYWEAVFICQTCVLVAVSVFGLTLGAYFQSLLLNAALALIVVLLLVVKPHASRLVGRVSLHSIGCLLLTSYVALTFLPVGTTRPSDVYKEVMGAFVLLINMVFVSSLLWKVFRLVDWMKLREKLGVGAKAVAQWFGVLQRNVYSRWLTNHCKGKQANSRGV